MADNKWNHLSRQSGSRLREHLGTRTLSWEKKARRMNRDEGFQHFEVVEVKLESEKAVCVEGRSSGAQFWVPKSQLHTKSEVSEIGDTGELWVTSWWAKKEGWS